MPIPVSAAFKAAEEADSNLLSTIVQLVLGDYASSGASGAAASSSGDFSTDYPAAGAINGDRTEINIGPAAGADNGVGKSSWRSAGVPDQGGAAVLTINFGATRTFNRTKLYHVNGHGLTSFLFEYWNGTQWIPYIGTADIVGIGQLGFGQTPFGDFPFGDPTPDPFPSVATVTTTLKVDTFDHADITGSMIRLTVARTEVASDNANVVEIEIYRLLDITDRIKSAMPNRARDYKLGNNMAAALTLTCDNSDRFFSPSYTPTAAEVTAGFVNSELRPGLSIFLKQGFDFGGPTEVVRTFTGTIDLFRPNSVSREAVIECRDGIKDTLNQVVSTKLKTNIDIGNIIVYLLNLANISNYEMSVDLTSIIQDYFFAFEKTILTAIQELVQACGDAQFYFDENGLATFRQYLQNVPQQHVDSSQADFNAGTNLQNIDTGSNPGAFRARWFLIDDFTFVGAGFPGPANVDPWVVDTSTNVTITQSNVGVDGFQVQIVSTNVTFRGDLHRAPFTLTTQNPSFGTFRFKAQGICTGNGTSIIQFITRDDGFIGISNPGYSLLFDATNVSLARHGAGSITSIATVAANDGLMHEWRITRDATGTFKVYKDLSGTPLATVTDGTITANDRMTFGSQGTLVGGATTRIRAIWWSNDLLPTDALPYDSPQYPKLPVFESQVIDQQATIASEGNIIINVDVPDTTGINFGGSTGFSTMISVYTATSADGSSFDPYILIATSAVGGTLTYAIPSTTRRYIKYKIELNILNFHSGYAGNVFIRDGHTPTVFDVTITWFTAAGQNKYHTTVDFNLRFDGSIQNIEQELSDNLGGDTAIINDVAVVSSPLILGGTNADTTWQGTANTPAAIVSAGNPYSVAPGVYTFNCVVPGGMDISLMTGANPAGAVVIFSGGAAGSWTFSYIHPTKPILRIVITIGGSISDLRLAGKTFQSENTPFQATASDAVSIAKYARRSQAISNSFIINPGIAAIIANGLVSLYKDPILYLPGMEIRQHPSMQLGDRVNVVDDNTGISADFNVVALSHVTAGSRNGAEAKSTVTLVKIPAGS